MIHPIPPGYLANAAGHLVPEHTVSTMDKERDALVKEIVQAARALQESMRQFRRRSMGDIRAFVELVGEKYQAKIGGQRGNITLRSFDGRYKVEIDVADAVIFDEKIHAAKALIDHCIHKWTSDAAPEIQALVEHAFQVDKEGRFNIGRILTLTRLAIEDEDWKNGMEAIKDSMTPVSSKSYIRIYERQGPDKPYTPIPLDMAAL